MGCFLFESSVFFSKLDSFDLQAALKIDTSLIYLIYGKAHSFRFESVVLTSLIADVKKTVRYQPLSAGKRVLS